MNGIKDKLSRQQKTVPLFLVIISLLFLFPVIVFACAVLNRDIEGVSREAGKQGKSGDRLKKVALINLSCPSLQAADTDADGIISVREAKQYNIEKMRIFGIRLNHSANEQEKADFEKVENVLRNGSRGFEDLSSHQKIEYRKWHDFILFLENKHRKAAAKRSSSE